MDAGEGDGRALLNVDGNMVGQQAHYAGRFDPGNLLELLLALLERNKENVAPDIAA